MTKSHAVSERRLPLAVLDDLQGHKPYRGPWVFPQGARVDGLPPKPVHDRKEATDDKPRQLERGVTFP